MLTAATPRVSATGEFHWFEGDGRTVIVRGRGGEQWRLEREKPGARVRAVRPDGVPTAWQRALIARSTGDGLVTVSDIVGVYQIRAGIPGSPNGGDKEPAASA